MFGVTPTERPLKLLFLLVPNFSMMAFTSSVEPLRTANRLAGEELYSWHTASVDGEPVTASNGTPLVPYTSIANLADPPAAVVACAGIDVERIDDPVLFGWLRRIARQGSVIGGVCTGPLLLAKAGVLDGYRCTIHWENMEAFAEEFPELDITATLFEVDRNRFTCSGGTAPLDMMLYMITEDHGQDLAVAVAEQLVHSIIRHPADPQRMSLRYRTGISHPKLLAAIAHMEAYLETPVGRDDLADAVGLSNRQLERLFNKYLGLSPARYYLNLRLKRARQLLSHTSMPILQVAVACGFTSASHFARCYRQVFGHAPRQERPAGIASA
ncbi:MAG: GlxA family transcriptional regulator [Alphaproteobacteria bacterium]